MQVTQKFIIVVFAGIFFPSCHQSTNKIKETNNEIEIKKFDLLQGVLEKSVVSYDSVNSQIEELTVDSLKMQLYFDFAYRSYKINDSVNFRHWNKRANALALVKNDTLNVAKSYWSLANFYYQENYSDSAYSYYNQAFLLYNGIKEDFSAGRMLLNMAAIQNDIKDYVGSEVTTIKAIEKIKDFSKDKQMYMAFNNLGIIYNELTEYDKSLEYHQRALQHLQRKKNLTLEASSLNNIGVVLHNMKKFGEAIQSYRQALSVDSIEIKDAELYAMLLDNLAHAKLISKDTIGIGKMFYRALSIRDSIGHNAGITMSKIHLSEYLVNNGDTINAVKWAEEAKDLAEKTGNFRDYLSAMKLLSEIDQGNSIALLNRYIELNDSLQKKERSVRNNFARIRFETDEFKAENQHLTSQKKWLIGGSSGVLILSFLIAIVFRQKARNRRLKNERDQQKANEDIYKLLLDQEKKIEEGKSKEKERISKELHDGILSEMYGIRFLLNNLNTKDDPVSVEARQKYLEGLRVIEEEIRFISRDLQSNDLLDEEGFISLLGHLALDQEEPLGFLPILKSDSGIEWEYIDNKVKMNLYRIVQEALRNIKKYAQANQASITFISEDGSLFLSIKDNGKGFDVNKKFRGIGLKNMKSRVNDIQGHLEILSNNFGTMIKIKISITNG